jgi:DNA invertase Pin-like site-specific DNA recombinase
MKVAIYARVSTEEQHAFKQIEACQKECEHRGFEIYKVYEDVISGSKSSRPSFNELLADMRKYKFNCVMVTKLDRLGRSLQHLLSLFEEFKTKGINFIALTQNIDTTSASGRLQLQIMGAFAEFERNLISERTKEGLSKAKNKHKIGKRGKDKVPRKRRGTLRKDVWN